MKYYYIIRNKIVKFEKELGAEYNHLKLTDEQTAFYEANPQATMREVLNMELAPPIEDILIN